jgi:hypothetical protein
MARPIETAVECRKELAALSATFEQPGWELKIKSAFPRWRDRTAQRLSQSVSLKASAEFAGLTRKRHSAPSESWVDIVARHLAFLEALINDIQSHPEEYGPAVIARERTVATAARERARTTPNRVVAAPPKEITMSWLTSNLNARILTFYVLTLLAAFALGVRVAHVPAIARIVGPPASVPPDTVRRPGGIAP